jgi:hypothetical protein
MLSLSALRDWSSWMIDQVEMRLVHYHVDEFFSERESIFIGLGMSQVSIKVREVRPRY